MRKIIVVSGLGDNGRELKLASTWWKKEGLEPIIFLPHWENEKGVKPKLTRLLRKINIESRDKKILLLGISAGASLAMNAFLMKPEKIEKVVSLCGRLKMGLSKDMIRRKLQENTLKRRAFRESVELLQKNLNKLAKIDKKRILTLSAEFGDEVIPLETSTLPGVKNIMIPAIEHVISIFSAMTVNFEPIKKFLLKK